MGLSLVTAPARDPVSVDEVKTHCRITQDLEDGLIAGYILAARQHIETWTRRALMTQSWRLTIDYAWPIAYDVGHRHLRYTHALDGAYYGLGLAIVGPYASRARNRIVLPRPPLQSVDAISYVDGDGNTQTLGPSQYQVAKADTGEWHIEPAYQVIWPLVREQMAAVTVDFTCGYGAAAGVIPEPIRMGMLLLISQWVDNRSAIAVGSTVSELPNAVQALVDPYRVYY